MPVKEGLSCRNPLTRKRCVDENNGDENWDDDDVDDADGREYT